ncbi:hypothetical protein LUCX_312 [Xanthomonas phage vB_XciM_LucasX]|nr:hypothetical protein LUCX_312 [Xanthomonas phage vB_XciM_LucasX]
MSDRIDPELSGMRLYSLGRAANNKALNSDELEITPIEQLSQLDGELVSLPFQSTAQGQRSDGSAYDASVTLNTALTAKWLPMRSNRRTAPDVRRGERVFIYRYKDTDQFYWTETGWDDHLRRLETIHLRVSATAQEDADMEDVSNWYHLAISTHEKLIHLETSLANGEKAKYALQINTATGVVSLLDDFGNLIQLESVEKIISLKNGDGTTWQLNKKDLIGYASDNMVVEAEKTIQLTTKAFTLKCQTGVVDASSSFQIKTPKFQVDSDTNTFNTPMSTFTGEVAVGSLTTGAAGGSGTASFAGPANFAQPITANGITSSAPITGPRDSI